MKSKIALILIFLVGYFSFPSIVFGQYYCTSVFHEAYCNSGWPGCSPYCVCGDCPCIGCEYSSADCCNCSSPPPCTGGCFTGETEITVKETGGAKETEQIKNLEAGDSVSSFDPETGEIKESTVSDVTKTTREGYYILETESGQKIKVTAEHPFLAIKAENSQKSDSDFQTNLNKLEEIFSHTLTYRLITNVKAKLTEIF